MEHLLHRLYGVDAPAGNSRFETANPPANPKIHPFTENEQFSS